MAQGTTAPRLLSAEAFSRAAGDRRQELVRGRVVDMSPVGGRHGDTVVRLAAALFPFVRAHALGWVTTETGFVLGRAPDTVRGPDLAFVARGRVPDPIPDGWLELAPDLAAEVVSPGDAYTQVLEKVEDYLGAGVVEVWLLDPRRRRAEVHRRGAPTRHLGPDDALTSDLLPGWSLRLGEVV